MKKHAKSPTLFFPSSGQELLPGLSITISVLADQNAFTLLASLVYLGLHTDTSY